MPLDQTRRGGGNVPATVLVVLRKFPVLLMASVDEAGTRETRTPTAHERATAAAAARAQQVCFQALLRMQHIAYGVPARLQAVVLCHAVLTAT